VTVRKGGIFERHHAPVCWTFSVHLAHASASAYIVGVIPATYPQPRYRDSVKRRTVHAGVDATTLSGDVDEPAKKQHEAPEYLERRRGRRRSNGFIHGRNSVFSWWSNSDGGVYLFRNLGGPFLSPPRGLCHILFELLHGVCFEPPPQPKLYIRLYPSYSTLCEVLGMDMDPTDHPDQMYEGVWTPVTPFYR